MIKQGNLFGEEAEMVNKKIYNAVTERGHSVMLLASALQKSIRRSDEHLCMLIVSDLIRSGYEAYLWKRLRIIAAEDIDYRENIQSEIRALYENAKDFQGHKDSKLFAYNAAMILVRAKKSRLADWLKCVYHDGPDTKEKEYEIKIPDYCLDSHTREGKQKGRGLLYFIKESTKLINKKIDEFKKEFEYKKETQRIWEKLGYIKYYEKIE